MKLTPKELFKIVAEGQSMWQQMCELRDRNRKLFTENEKLRGELGDRKPQPLNSACRRD